MCAVARYSTTRVREGITRPAPADGPSGPESYTLHLLLTNTHAHRIDKDASFHMLPTAEGLSQQAAGRSARPARRVVESVVSGRAEARNRAARVQPWHRITQMSRLPYYGHESD